MELAISEFQAITLEEIEALKDSVSLQDRHDTKFVLSRDKLPQLLSHLIPNYKILEINRERFFGYQTLYFDTDKFHCYYQHHNQNLSRYKLRYRKYVNTGQCYFEIKLKSNKRKTYKKRIKQAEIKDHLCESTKQFIQKTFNKKAFINSFINTEEMLSRLWTSYSRLTLVNPSENERLTLDLNLAFQGTETARQALNHIVIAELKQKQQSLNSPFMETARQMRIFPTSFSKYCIGTALIYNTVRINRFKKHLLKIRKINGGIDKHDS